MTGCLNTAHEEAADFGISDAGWSLQIDESDEFMHIARKMSALLSAAIL